MDPIKHIEIDTILYVLSRAYGLDFREYKKNIIESKIDDFLREHNLGKVSDLMDLCLHDKMAAASLIDDFLTDYTTMFRDPALFKKFIENVLPVLKTEPMIRIWCAGCATGEEAYTIAMILKEYGLYDRSMIYATDISPQALLYANKGVYKPSKIAEFRTNCELAGMGNAIDKYIDCTKRHMQIHSDLKKNLIFSKHDLVMQPGFNEFSIVFCRNVMIYFNDALKYKVIKKLYDNMKPLGFLITGIDEDLLMYTKQLMIEPFVTSGIYRKKGS